MATLNPSSKITVRFALTKGDGEYPGVDEFSKKEVSKPLSFTKFVLTWDDEVAEAEGVTKDLIKDCLVVLSKNSLTRFVRVTGAKLLMGLKFSVVVGQ